MLFGEKALRKLQKTVYRNILNCKKVKPFCGKMRQWWRHIWDGKEGIRQKLGL